MKGFRLVSITHPVGPYVVVALALVSDLAYPVTVISIAVCSPIAPFSQN